jgi:hypothetical protein
MMLNKIGRGSRQKHGQEVNKTHGREVQISKFRKYTNLVIGSTQLWTKMSKQSKIIYKEVHSKMSKSSFGKYAYLIREV